jgi:glycosyltransferase involved in cell wall biosynthesis
MRILHVTQCDHAGVPRHIAALSAFQAEGGATVAVAGPPQLCVGDGVVHRSWTARSAPFVDPRELISLSRIIDGFAPDVVHLHSSKAGLVGRLVMRGRLATVFTPHSWSFAREGPTRLGARAWERWAARWTTVVLTLNIDEVASTQSFRWRQPPVMISNGVDVASWTPADAAARERARRELGLDPGAPVALCVGRLVRQKGQLELARRWERVRARAPGATLVLVGDGPHRAAIAACRAPDVLLAGATDRVRAWYAAADVCVQPSRWEGMSYVTLEAMASGLPVVAFDVGGMRPALGDGGHLVEPGDHARFVDAVSELLSDGAARAALGARNRARAVAEFDERPRLEAIDRVVRAVV